MSYNKPSEALAHMMRKLSGPADDYTLIPITPELYEEAKAFLQSKYGIFVTRESLMFNGHLITPEFHTNIPRKYQDLVPRNPQLDRPRDLQPRLGTDLGDPDL